MRAATEEVRLRGALEVRTCAIFCHASPARLWTPHFIGRKMSADAIPIPWSYQRHHQDAYPVTRSGTSNAMKIRKTVSAD
jgi:hypothetical protein